MKRLISVLLCILMIISMLAILFSTSAASRTMRSQYPVICFGGNGPEIYDENGDQVYDFDVSSDQIKEISKRVLPLLAKGAITNDYTPYYEAFEDELDKLYGRAQLDSDGNPQYGTKIAQHLLDDDYNKQRQDRAENGTYSHDDYKYWYDWRLDPCSYADKIDAYINNILEVTQKDKVCLVSTCLGGDMLLAYIEKYGTSKINAITFNSTVAFGSSLIADAFSGSIYLDMNGAERFAGDYFFKNNVLSNNYDLLSEFVKTTLALANESGIGALTTKTFQKTFYEKVLKGLFPYVIRASYGTWAGYWTAIPTDRYEETKEYVFGKEGSETYQKYAGLIEKLDYYNYNVKSKAGELILNAKEDNLGVAITAKYGQQMVPILDNTFENGDVWTLLKRSSFGATVSDIGTTLSEEYIESRIAEGYGKYISPDKQVDASTCVLPDNTWFIKGAVHDEWMDAQTEIEMTVCNSTPENRFDIYSDSERPQFLIWDREVKTFYPMTEENANNETYEIDEQNKSSIEKIKDFFKNIKNWWKLLFEVLKTYVLKK